MSFELALENLNGMRSLAHTSRAYHDVWARIWSNPKRLEIFLKSIIGDYFNFAIQLAVAERDAESGTKNSRNSIEVLRRLASIHVLIMRWVHSFYTRFNSPGDAHIDEKNMAKAIYLYAIQYNRPHSIADRHGFLKEYNILLEDEGYILGQKKYQYTPLVQYSQHIGPLERNSIKEMIEKMQEKQGPFFWRVAGGLFLAWDEKAIAMRKKITGRHRLIEHVPQSSGRQRYDSYDEWIEWGLCESCVFYRMGL